MKHALIIVLSSVLLIAASAQDTVEKSQAEAIRLYPHLAQKDSPLNKAFVALHQQATRTNPQLLANPDWPLTLARQAAASLGIAQPNQQATPPPAAEDLTTVSGKKYTGVTVNRVEADGLAISHDHGAAKVPFSDLSEDIRKKYANPPVRILGTVTQARKNGLLVDDYIHPEFIRNGGMHGIADPKRPKTVGAGISVTKGARIYYLTGHPNQDQIVDGDNIDVDAVPDGTYSYGGGKVKQFKVIKAYKHPFPK